jgi:hypothetical protein
VEHNFCLQASEVDLGGQETNVSAESIQGNAEGGYTSRVCDPQLGCSDDKHTELEADSVEMDTDTPGQDLDKITGFVIPNLSPRATKDLTMEVLPQEDSLPMMGPHMTSYSHRGAHTLQNTRINGKLRKLWWICKLDNKVRYYTNHQI